MSWGVATQNGVSVSLASIVSLSAGVTEFSPYDLFTGGTVGAWYDPSDYSTLFQDSAGTTPVTAVEQPVGLMLDKSQGLVLGPELITNGDFSNGTTGWTFGASVTASVESGRLKCVCSSGGLSNTNIPNFVSGKSYKVTFELESPAGTSMFFYNAGGTPQSTQISGNGTMRSISIIVRAGSSSAQIYISGPTGFTYYLDNISVKELPGNHAVAPNDASRPVLRARYNTLLATETLATQSVTTLAASYKLAFSGSGSITLSGTATGTYSAGTNTITCTAGTLTLTVSGTVTQADLRLASTATSMPAYQRVTTSTDYATAGFLPYLDLITDDSLSTGSINFTATDKMFVCAGIQKNSDSGEGVIAELSASWSANNGTFVINAPADANPNLGFGLRGTTSTYFLPTTFTSPIRLVESCSFDISQSTRATEIVPRVNGTVNQTNPGGGTDAGTGNFGNHPMFIGRRNNASAPLNGRIYGLIVAGKLASASEISATEAWMNSKTGAY